MNAVQGLRSMGVHAELSVLIFDYEKYFEKKS